jgi:hypothetical protein
MRSTDVDKPVTRQLDVIAGIDEYVVSLLFQDQAGGRLNKGRRDKKGFTIFLCLVYSPAVPNPTSRHRPIACVRKGLTLGQRAIPGSFPNGITSLGILRRVFSSSPPFVYYAPQSPRAHAEMAAATDPHSNSPHC